MRVRMPQLMAWTRSERRLALAMAVVGLFGGLVALLLVVRLDPAAFFERGLLL